MKNEFVKGSFILFIMFNIFNFLNFVFQFSMIRLLGPADYSVLAVLMTFLYFVAIPSESIQLVVARYSAKFKVENSKEKLKDLLVKIYRKGVRMSFYLFIFLIPVFAVLAYFMEIDFVLFLIIGLSVFSIFLLSPNKGALQGLGRFKSLGVNMLTEGGIKVGLSIILVLVGMQVFGAVFGIVLSMVGAFFVSSYLLNDVLGGKRDESGVSKIYSYGTPVVMTLVAVMLFQSLDILISRLVFSENIAGQYAAANQIGKIIFFGTAAISKAMFPLSSAEFEKGVSSKKMLYRSLGMVAGLSSVALVAFAVFPDLIISILAGPEYVEVTKIVFKVGVAFTMISLTNITLLYGISVDKPPKILQVVGFLIVQTIILFVLSESLDSFATGMMLSGIFLFLSSLFVVLKRR